mmetsp:Transcript_153763/g.493038  ORF Transcript_153763/g.493038 Transcript_153763/m.493038 type:complete len:241 (-) Transcript_153763:2156-2878(-)
MILDFGLQLEVVANHDELPARGGNRRDELRFQDLCRLLDDDYWEVDFAEQFAPDRGATDSATHDVRLSQNGDLVCTVQLLNLLRESVVLFEQRAEVFAERRNLLLQPSPKELRTICGVQCPQVFAIGQPRHVAPISGRGERHPAQALGKLQRAQALRDLLKAATLGCFEFPLNVRGLIIVVLDACPKPLLLWCGGRGPPRLEADSQVIGRDPPVVHDGILEPRVVPCMRLPAIQRATSDQ